MTVSQKILLDEFAAVISARISVGQYSVDCNYIFNPIILRKKFVGCKKKNNALTDNTD